MISTYNLILSNQLLDAINKALKELTEDGTIAAIIEKYIPSNG